MSRATMMAALLGMAVAVPRCDAPPAEAEVRTAIEPATKDQVGLAPAERVPGEPEEVMGAPFTVERVDRSNRSLVVESRSGSLTTIRVAPTAAGFEEVATGDRIALDYFRSSLVSLGPTRALVAAADQTPTRASAPVLGAAGGRQITGKAHVTEVDGQAGTLQVTTADGRPHAFVIQDPAVRERLSSLRDGDEVTVTYTEAVAVGLRTATGS